MSASWSRDEIYQRLTTLQDSIKTSQRTTDRMKSSLSRLLKEKHPIHQFVGKLPDPQLKRLYGQLCPNGKQRERKRWEPAVLTYFFKYHSEAPLTALQEVLVSVQDPGKF